jgi:plastocyanin
MKTRVFLVAISIIAVGAIGTLPAAQGGTGKGGISKARVRVVDFEFNPSTVKIRAGGKVTWAFRQGQHNVVGKGWKSRIKSGGTYTRRFKKRGTYNYRCTLHPPDMKGVVRVVRR